MRIKNNFHCIHVIFLLRLTPIFIGSKGIIMNYGLLILCGFSCALAQERKVYHVSTDLNPVLQMSAHVQVEYKKFLLEELRQETQREDKDIKQKSEAEKIRANL